MTRAASYWHGFSEVLLDLIYPKKCSLCGLCGAENPCQACLGEMSPQDLIVIAEIDSPLDFRASLYPYEGRAAQMVRRLKYSRSTSLAKFMTVQISEAIPKLGTFDAVIPVPIHWSRQCVRGFNQSDLITEGIAVRARDLRRTRATRPQVGLNREQRSENLLGAFTAVRSFAGADVLLIDDVVTSGQTARECARALRDQGARGVGILAICGDANWNSNV
ncbi:ComF family protein [soil metagenome]